MENFTIENLNLILSLVCSSETLLQIEWWNNHRSAATIFHDLLEIQFTERYLLTNPKAVELWLKEKQLG